MRRNGLQDYDGLPACDQCSNEPGVFRCRNCTEVTLYCSVCIARRHEHLPLHHIEVCSQHLVRYRLTISKVWQDGFYQRANLSELLPCFYVGHNHTACPSAEPPQSLLVIDINGVHHLRVQYCDCKETPGWVPYYRQLLRIGWYPASFDRPRTAFTFDLLDHYHGLTLQGKLNLYDFHSSIVQKTNNYNQKKPVVCIPTLCSDTRH